MAYFVFIGKKMMPVAPESIRMKVNNQNKTLNLINQGEFSIVKKAGLTDIDFDLLLPNVEYPFATYDEGFQNAKHYLEYFEQLKTGKKKVQFIVSRQLPNGKVLYSTNLTVTLEEYTAEDSVDEGFDVNCSVSLKQYVPFETKTAKIKTKKKKKKVKKKKNRQKKATPSKNKKYTVVKGDCLWAIARKFYGDGTKYTKIKDANASLLKGRSPNLIYPGDVLTIPPA